MSFGKALLQSLILSPRQLLGEGGSERLSVDVVGAGVGGEELPVGVSVLFDLHGFNVLLVPSGFDLAATKAERIGVCVIEIGFDFSMRLRCGVVILVGMTFRSMSPARV